MARSKHLSLEEARKISKLDQFARQTEYQKADKQRFDRLLDAMASGKKPATDRTSDAGFSAC